MTQFARRDMPGGDAVTDRSSFAEPGARADACRTDSCITCGDVAVQVPIVRLLPHSMALVATDAGDEEVSIALVEASVGDTVLVHAGEAIARIS